MNNRPQMQEISKEEIEAYINKNWVPESGDELLEKYLSLKIIALGDDELGVKATIKDAFYGWIPGAHPESEPDLNILVDCGFEDWLSYRHCNEFTEQNGKIMRLFGAKKASDFVGLEVMAIVNNFHFNYLSGICPLNQSDWESYATHSRMGVGP